MDITIRAVRPEEYEALGELTAQAYLGDGLLAFADSDEYLIELRDVARRAAEAEVLVAVERGAVEPGAVQQAERLLGGVTFTAGGGPLAELAGDGEAEIRMLAVARADRRRGAGEALVRACVERARAADGCRRVVLSSQQAMRTAHRVYERLGFVRTPERDWVPVPGVTLHTYALPL
ncbi:MULTISPECIES: GNAT family N-acetyltransferase [unclassified Streptomyces]|uniref:GNAT family N-acetyltransferase n=1 Tax=unclassified Streptomyces TaxID=2593676 RepID=UPI0033B3DAA5